MLAHDDGEETKLQQPPMMHHNEIKLIANGEMSVRNRVQQRFDGLTDRNAARGNSQRNRRGSLRKRDRAQAYLA